MEILNKIRPSLIASNCYRPMLSESAFIREHMSPAYKADVLTLDDIPINLWNQHRTVIEEIEGFPGILVIAYATGETEIIDTRRVYANKIGVNSGPHMSPLVTRVMHELMPITLPYAITVPKTKLKVTCRWDTTNPHSSRSISVLVPDFLDILKVETIQDGEMENVGGRMLPIKLRNTFDHGWVIDEFKSAIDNV